jgi:hypothetical protein
VGFVKSPRGRKMIALPVSLRRQDPGLDPVGEVAEFRCSVGRETHSVHDSWRCLYFDLAHRSCQKIEASTSKWKECRAPGVVDDLFVWQELLVCLRLQTRARSQIILICCEALEGMQSLPASPFVGHLHYSRLRALFCVLLDPGMEKGTQMMMGDSVYFSGQGFVM